MLIQSFYDMDVGALNYVIATTVKKWKEFKSDLKQALFDETLTDEELMEKWPKSVNEANWKWLIDHWMSPEAEVRHNLLWFALIWTQLGDVCNMVARYLIY